MPNYKTAQMKLLRTISYLQNTSWVLGSHRRISSSASEQIDSWRGASALAVVVAHAQQIFVAPLYSGAYPIFGLASQFAVMVFFALSGFLICKSATRNFRDNSRFDLREYAVDRLNRILPPFVFSLVFLALLCFVSPYVFPSGTSVFIEAGSFMARHELDVTALQMFGALFFVNGFLTETPPANGALWSLPYEVWYYFAFGLMLAVRGRLGLVLAAGFMLALGMRNNGFILLSMVWASGALVAVLHNNNLINAYYAKWVTFVFGVIALMFAGSYLVRFYGGEPVANYPRSVVLWSAFSGVSFCGVLALVVNGAMKGRALFGRTARFSYTLYLSHYPLLLFIYGVSQQGIMHDLVLSFVVAIVSALGCVVFASVVAGYVENYRLLKARPKETAAAR
ncbi:acyltransferase family protein [Pseudomonas xanthosomatis]|uniref:acyltransferase family protein n=1 Tax=Pseudomonas xanthosomatis TaxID=2842356 RepID=UPI003512D3DF